MSITAKEVGLEGSILSVRDLWTHEDLPCVERFAFTVAPHGTVVLRVKGEREGRSVDLHAPFAYREPAPITTISREQARALVAAGALLLDARTREEYAQGHLAGALCTPFTEIYSHIAETVPTKDTPCVVYCSKGLRSRQVKYTMDHMGYTAVCLLDAISPDEREL